MPELTTTEWTCSRCKTTTVLPNTDQPHTWSRLLGLTPPRSTINADGAQFLGDLCQDCADALGYFLRNMSVATHH